MIADNIGQQQLNQPGASNYEAALKVHDLSAPDNVVPKHLEARLGLLEDLDRDFAAERPGVAPRSHQLAYDRAVRLMRRMRLAPSTSRKKRPPSATPMAATCSVRVACWPAGWSSAACLSSR